MPWHTSVQCWEFQMWCQVALHCNMDINRIWIDALRYLTMLKFLIAINFFIIIIFSSPMCVAMLTTLCHPSLSNTLHRAVCTQKLRSLTSVSTVRSQLVANHSQWGLRSERGHFDLVNCRAIFVTKMKIIYHNFLQEREYFSWWKMKNKQNKNLSKPNEWK